MQFQPLLLFLLFVNPLAGVSFAQPDESWFYVAEKSHEYFVEIKGYDAFVFYEPVMTSNQFYFGKRVYVLDTLCYETKEYAGNLFHLAVLDNNLYLLANPGVKHIPKKIKVDYTKDVNAINLDLNGSYWLENYVKMSQEIDSLFPYASFSNSSVWNDWRTFPVANSYYMDFRAYADSLIPVYKDSVIQAHTAYTEVLNRLSAGIPTLTADELISELENFPNGNEFKYNEYTQAIVNEIAEKRPELFYEIAEKSGSGQGRLFLMVSKPAIKTLKNFETDSPAKKAFIKYCRK